MKHNGRSNLGKTLARGEKIVVRVPTLGVYNARVRRNQSGGRILCEYAVRHRLFTAGPQDTHRMQKYTLRRRDEGITWARGWDGEVADALRVAAALA